MGLPRSLMFASALLAAFSLSGAGPAIGQTGPTADKLRRSLGGDPSGSVAPIPDPEPPVDYEFTLRLEPLPGHTTRPCPAPERFGVAVREHAPLVTMTARIDALSGLPGAHEFGFRWEGLNVVEEREHGPGEVWESTAAVRFDRPGEYPIRVIPIVDGAEQSSRALTSVVVAHGISVSDIEIAVGIAAPAEDEGMPVLWAETDYVFSGTTEPPEFAALLEWEHSTRFLGIGSGVPARFGPGGTATVEACLNREPVPSSTSDTNVLLRRTGRTNRQSFDVVVVDTTIVEQPSETDMAAGRTVRYIARTEPEGYERFVQWTTDTMWPDSATPSEGAGREFVTTWDLAIRGSTIWYGISANEEHQEGDPQPNCLLERIQGPWSLRLGNGGEFDAYNTASERIDATCIVTWTSSTPSVATVDPQTGRVTTVGTGTTTITGTSSGGGSDQRSLRVFVDPPPPPPATPTNDPGFDNGAASGNAGNLCGLSIVESPVERRLVSNRLDLTAQATGLDLSTVVWSSTPPGIIRFDDGTGTLIAQETGPTATVVFVDHGDVTLRIDGMCDGGGDDFDELDFRVLDIRNQFPLFNSPVETFGLGVGSGCPDGDCPEETGVPFGASDIDHPGNRSGAAHGLLPHSGQQVLEATDLFVRGRDATTALRIQRRHMTRVNQENSIFGPAWAFNYRHTITEELDGSMTVDSFGRTDRFDAVGPAAWQGTEGRLDRLTYDSVAGRFEMRLPHGTILEFVAAGSSPNRVGLLEVIRSPNGNTIELTHDTQPAALLARTLQTIRDSFGRTVQFNYGGDVDFPEGVSSIVDFDNREVVYDYDADGNLRSVRSPTVQSTDGLNDFIDGKTTRYDYHTATDPRLRHAVTDVVYPQELSTGGLETRKAWTFDDADPNDVLYGFATSFAVGNGSVGGTYTVDQRGVFDPAATSPDANTPLVHLTATDRSGTVSRFDCNRLGQVVQESIESRNVRGDDPVDLEFNRDFSYTEDGDLVDHTSPLQNGSLRTHPDPLSHPRNSHANEIERIANPDPGRTADQPEIRAQTIYEPVFNRPFRVIDPRGFEPGNIPDDFTTTFRYDYMEDLGAAATFFAPELGLDAAALSNLFADAGITDLAGDVNGDGLVDQRAGNVIRVEHPRVVRHPTAFAFGLSAIEVAIEVLRFNDFGQRVYHEDEENNVTEWSYHPAEDPDGDGVIDVPGAGTSGGGYLQEVRRDTTANPLRSSGQDPTPVDQTTRFEYTAQNGGMFPGNLRGIPTADLDPRGIRDVHLVNELDQIVKTLRAFEVEPDSPEFGIPVFGYESRTLYDANDRVVERQIRNTDGLDGEDDFIVHRYDYDILDQLIAEELDACPVAPGCGFLEIRNTYEYDESQNRIRQVRGDDDPNVRAIDTFTFDERDILVTSTRGLGETEEATHTTKVDDNGNVVKVIDADPVPAGDETIYTFDGFDRLSKTTDPVGNETIREYDSASNVVSTRQFGARDGGAGAPMTDLARTDVVFDERNRPFRTDRHLFLYAGRGNGEFSLDPGSGSAGSGLVTTLAIFDRASRVVGVVDADDDRFETRYDGLSRILETIDPAGNRTERVYDANDNLKSVQEFETSTAFGGTESFTTTFQYDALNRMTESVEPNSQTTRLQYDSRDNSTVTTDELGNEVELRHDRLNRLVDTRIYLVTGGEGASATMHDDVITKTRTFDSLHRISTMTDDSGNTTTYVYDRLDRRVTTTYEDGTTDVSTYDRDGNLDTHTNQNGSVQTWTYDPDDRPTRVDVTNPGTGAEPILGSEEKRWEYDGLDRDTLSFDDNGAGDDVTTETWYDSLSRKIREIQTVPGRTSYQTDTEWQGARRKIATMYPDGARRVTRDYDNLDRLVRIREHQGPTIATFDYVGRYRDARIEFGNGTVLDKRNMAGDGTTTGTDPGYDSNRRHVRHAWTASGGGEIATYRNTYNGNAGVGTNRRESEIREHLGREDTYVFDSAYRMIGFTRDVDSMSQTGGTSSTRTLDGTDKMTTLDDEGTARNPTIAPASPEAQMNQYSSIDGTTRTYDDNASLENDGTYKYLHDYQNRIVEIRDQADMTLAAYVYAADNRRILRTVGADTTRYLYDGWQVLEERDGTDTLLRQYVDGRRIDEHVQMTDVAAVGSPEYYYHGNSQGFVGALTDDAGSVVELYEYSWLGRAKILDPDGVTERTSSSFGNPYLFQGRRYDPETEATGRTGLYYFRNRYYDPNVGEFVTIDPLGNWNHGQGNGFSAFGEDPWNKSDPFGLDDKVKMQMLQALSEGVRECGKFADKCRKDSKFRRYAADIERLHDLFLDKLMDDEDSAFMEHYDSVKSVLEEVAEGQEKLSAGIETAEGKLELLKKILKAQTGNDMSTDAADKFLRELKSKNSALGDTLGRIGKTFDAVDRGMEIEEYVSRGDAIGLILNLGSAAPPGVGDMLGYYSEAYDAAMDTMAGWAWHKDTAALSPLRVIQDIVAVCRTRNTGQNANPKFETRWDNAVKLVEHALERD